MSENVAVKKKRTYSAAKLRERGFLLSVWIFPIILFAVLYVYINFNSVLLAFKDVYDDNYSYSWTGFVHFKEFAVDVVNDPRLTYCFGNSMIIFAFTLFVNLPLHVLVSYFLFKKVYGSGIFKILLFLPSIISITVWVTMFRYFFDYGVPAICDALGAEQVFLLNKDTAEGFYTMLAFSTWYSFAGGMLVYLGSMSRIPKSLMEAAQLDGIGIMQEFIYICVPLLYPVLGVTLITSIPAIFTNSLQIYPFFAETAGTRLYTFGYYLFIQVIGGQTASVTQYPYAAAGGLLITIIVCPLTMSVRYLVNKFDPEVSY